MADLACYTVRASLEEDRRRWSAGFIPGQSVTRRVYQPGAMQATGLLDIWRHSR
jgi:hypothetical protein